jgi:hypothetical protein
MMSSPSASALLRILALVVGMAAGAIVFLNYFAPVSPISDLAQPVLQAVVLLTAAALLFGSLNLFVRHLAQLRQRRASLAVVAGFLFTFVGGLLSGGFDAGWGRWTLEWLLIPGLAALFALLPIFLAFALYQRLRIRDLGMLLFVVGLLLVLLGQTPALAPLFAGLRHNLLVGPVAATWRGVLIGLALGIVLAAFARLRLRGER